MFSRAYIPVRRFLSSSTRPTGNLTKNLNDRRKASEEKFFREQERDLLKKLQESLKESVQKGIEKGKKTVTDSVTAAKDIFNK